MDKLNEWFKTFINIPKLSFEETKKILNQAKNSDNNELKNQLYNKVVLGTMYIIYDYIKNNKLYNVVSQDFDMDDLTSSFTRQWITLIRSIDFEEFNSFEQVLQSYRLKYKSLVGISRDHTSDIADKTNAPSPRKIFRQEQIRDFFKDYISAIHLKGECTVADLRGGYYDWRFDQYDDSLVALIEIFDDLYFHSWDPKRYEKGVLSPADLQVVTARLKMKSEETVSIFDQDIEEKTSIIDEDIKRMFSEDIIGDALKTLTPREKAIIKKYFGLGNERKMSSNEIAEEFNVSISRINQLINKAAAKIRFYIVDHSRAAYSFKDLIGQGMLLKESEIRELGYYGILDPDEMYIARQLFSTYRIVTEAEIRSRLHLTKEQYDQSLAHVIKVLNSQKFIRYDIEDYSPSQSSNSRK